MFSINNLNQNLPLISAELGFILKAKRIAPIFASAVGSCVYEMKSSNANDFAYNDLDIVVMANNLQSNQGLNFTHKFKDFKLDIQALPYSHAQELISSHYLFMLECALAPKHLVFINSPKSPLVNLKFSKQILKSRQEKVMTDTINKSFNLLNSGFAQNNKDLIEQGKKLTWQAMRVDLMTQFLSNRSAIDVYKSEEFKTSFFSVANIYYEKLQSILFDIECSEDWGRAVQSVSNHFVLNDFNTIFCKVFSTSQSLINFNTVAQANHKINY